MVDAPGMLWLNDGLALATEAGISPRDRGFTLGDGVFETIRVKDGKPLWLALHLARLRIGARVIDLELPWSDLELGDAIARTLSANQLSGAAIRLSVSRGVAATRGLLAPVGTVPTLVIDAQPFAGYPERLYETGMAAISSTSVRNERSPLSGIKSLAYLDNVLARREAAGKGADEAILPNTTGAPAGASAASLFLVSGGHLLTPDVSSGALPGITRGLILDCLASDCGLEALPAGVTRRQLEGASEAFLTSSLLGVMPLTMLDGAPVGSGQPGIVTTQVQRALCLAELGNE